MKKFSADIVGQWQLTRVVYQHKENGVVAEQAVDNSPEGNTVIFNADGTGVYDERMTWTLSGDQLVITDDYGTDRLKVESLSADELELSGADHYEEPDIVFDDLYRDTYRRVSAIA